MGELIGAELRRRYRVAAAVRRRRRLRTTVAALAMAVPAVLLTPAQAAPGRALHLQGTSTATEFAVQPYWPASGTVGGRHYHFEAGLLAFVDDHGPAGTGYCIDLRTHRLHSAEYNEGADLDASPMPGARQVLWLLRHAYPRGPALLGMGPDGAARTSSAVQAAIWHFSDGFELDPAGAPFVDARYHAAYTALVRAAAAAAPPAPGLALSPRPGTIDLNALAPGSAVDITGTSAAPVVSLWTDSGSLGVAGGALAVHDQAHPLTVHTRAGAFSARLVVQPRPSFRVTVRATALVPVVRGRLLTSVQVSQRLVETVASSELLRAETTLRFAAHANPVLVKRVIDLGRRAVAPGSDLLVSADPGDHLRYQLECSNPGLVAYEGRVTDDLGSSTNSKMLLLRTGRVFGSGRVYLSPHSVLSWVVTVGPGARCEVGFEAEVPSDLPVGLTEFVNCAQLTVGGTPTSSNCVRVVVRVKPSPGGHPQRPPVVVAAPPSSAAPPMPAVPQIAGPTPRLPSAGHDVRLPAFLSLGLVAAGTLILLMTLRGRCGHDPSSSAAPRRVTPKFLQTSAKTSRPG